MACQVQPAALALRYVRGHAGEIAAGAFPVRLGNDLGRDGGERPHRLPAPLFGEAAALGRRRSIAGQPPIPGPFPACGAALADRRLENEAGGERGGPELAGARAFQRLAPFQAERLAVGARSPAVYPQMRGDRPQRPATQVTDHQLVVDDDFADRRVEHGPVGQHACHRAHRPAGAPGGGRLPRCPVRSGS
jgi:hypothetical protein